MGAALVLLLVGLGAMAAGVLIGRYYVPDDRQLRRTARHSRAYMRALSHLVARDHETVISELRGVVEENVEDTEPYFALGAVFRTRGEHERAIRVHQALAVRERDKKKLRQRAMYELGLDFRAAGMPRRATKAMEEVLGQDAAHEGAMRVLAALYEEQARFSEAAAMWGRLGRKRNEDTSLREHHLLVAAAQAAMGREDLDSGKQWLKAAQKIEHHETSAHWLAAAAELAAARGNWRAARDRIKQALIANVGLAPHLLPGLIAAEQELLAVDGGETKSRGRVKDELDEWSDSVVSAEISAKQLAAASSKALPAGADDGDELAAAPSLEDSLEAKPSVATSDATSAAPSAGLLPPASTTSPGYPVVQAKAPANPGTVVAPKAPPTSTLTMPLVATVAPANRVIEGVPLVAEQPAATVAQRVSMTLGEVELQTGARLELALIRAQLVPASDVAARAELARELNAKFPDALAARVAAARLAMVGQDAGAARKALEGLVGDQGALAWALRGRWQCGHCGHRPSAFGWRCAQCRRWSTLRMETGIEPAPVAPRERRAAPRSPRPESLLGSSPDDSLPSATLDGGLSESDLARAGTRRSLLGRMGGWFSGLRRDG